MADAKILQDRGEATEMVLMRVSKRDHVNFLKSCRAKRRGQRMPRAKALVRFRVSRLAPKGRAQYRSRTPR